MAVARKLELRTDLAELLPADHPAVVALREVGPRQRSASSLVVLIDSDDPARSAAFADALAPRLRQLHELTAVDSGPDREPSDFAQRWRWLYAPLPDLQEIERLADELVAERSNPAYVSLDDEDPADALSRRESEMKSKLPMAPAHARFQSDDGKIVGLRAWRTRDGLGGTGDHGALEAVKRAVASLDRAGVRVRYTGPIAQAVEEQAAIRDDISIASIACAVLVLLALYLAFGRMALVLAALWPTVLGLLLALALAQRALGALNLNTAFLISIILGNGINAPIVILAELRRAQEGGLSLPRALSRALLRSFRGVCAAMLSAAAAYGVLGATRFRGFRQFGLIGGVGMVAVLVSTYLALPTLILVWHAHAPRWLQGGRDRFSPPILRALRALEPTRTRIIVAILVTVCAVGAARFAHAPVEWNLRNLRSRQGEATKLWHTMEELGLGSVGAGYIANTAVMLVEDPARADRVAGALKAHDAADNHLLARVRTLDSLLPDKQTEKLAALSRLRARIDDALQRHGDVLKDDERKRLINARPPELRAITVDDLPRAVREAFTEVDGTRGRLVGIDADPKRYHDWDGHELLLLAPALTVDVDGRHYVAASTSTVFAGMLETLLHDAPRLSCLALGVVCALLIVTLPGRAAYALASLTLGLLFMSGLAGLFGLRLNFMSFAAVPISIGVGADYAANLWSRMSRHESTNAVAATVALCSLTTVIGYSTLLLGHNGALRSFGLLCDLGEVSCLAAVLLSPSLFAFGRPLPAAQSFGARKARKS